jgi:hypothetical protein
MAKILLNAAAKNRTQVRIFECCGFALVSTRIRIQLFISMQIRIQGAKLLRIHADRDPVPCQTVKSQKIEYLYEKYTLVGTSRPVNLPTIRSSVPDPCRKFFCLLLFEGTFTSLFKDKKSKRSHKTAGIFLLFLLADRRIRI